MKVELWKSKINTYEGYPYERCLQILEQKPEDVNECGVAGAEFDSSGTWSLLWSKGIGWHNDPLVGKWSAFLILYTKNYRFEVVESPDYIFSEQIFAGDILIWSSHDEHRSTNAKVTIQSDNLPSHAIVTLCKEYDKKPTRKQAKEDLTKLLHKEIAANGKS